MAEGKAELIPNPFVIFPEETWENILSQLEDSRDILNVFQAYPDLQGRVLKNKYEWLIDQVYEHLSPWLERKDELVCRQVSRRWCRAVDTDMDKWHVPVLFDRTNDLGSFLQKMVTHPPSRTPFVGRSVMIDDPGTGGEDMDYDQKLFWTRATEIFRRFGGHVWFINLRNGMENTVQFCRIMLEILRCVPNLKSLEVELSRYEGIVDYSYAADEFMEGQKNLQLVPLLPQLERMEFTDFCEVGTDFLITEFGRFSASCRYIQLCCRYIQLGCRYKSANFPQMFTGEYDSAPELLILHLINRYSPQIKKLGLQHLYHWRPEYYCLFPKLEELNLCGEISFEQVTDIMLLLETPDLKKVSLELTHGGRGAVENNIVLWLEDFPLIQELEIIVFHVGEDVQEDLSSSFSIPTTINIPTLKKLVIEGAVEEIDFSFLECFPSLEFFKVCAYDGPPKYFGGRNPYDPEIWKMLPKLKDLYISKKELPALPKHFTRAKYDWLKERKERRMSGPPDVECLMHSFDAMLSDN